ncbi:MAG TPA: tyrosine-type recombinase/integrase [Rhodanobacteraceae bacterium]
MVTLPAVHNARSRRATDAEMDAILAATGSPDLPGFAYLLAETAMRRGELQGLAWANVNRAERRATLPDTRNGTTRVVPLPKRAVAIPQNRPQPHRGAVFPSGPGAMTRAWARTRTRERKAHGAGCRKAGTEPSSTFVSGACMHDLGREATSRLARKLQVLDLATGLGTRI